VAAPESARGVDAGALQPALDPVDAGAGRRRELRALAGDAGHDDHDYEDGDGHERDQNERRSERARHVPVEYTDDGHRDHRHDERADHRPGNRVCLGEQPDEPEHEREQPHQQPGAAAEIAQPARRAERILQAGVSGSARVVALDCVHRGEVSLERRLRCVIPAG